jgi:hypothetical protein
MIQILKNIAEANKNNQTFKQLVQIVPIFLD